MIVNCSYDVGKKHDPEDPVSITLTAETPTDHLVVGSLIVVTRTQEVGERIMKQIIQEAVAIGKAIDQQQGP